MRPWEYSTELTEARLVKIAQLIEFGRNDAVDRHEPDIGDDGWTLGVRGYNCARYRISQMAGKTGFEWLSVIDDGMKFQFAIGGVPMRFWRGDPQEPPSKIAMATPIEQLSLDLEPESPSAGVIFRIGIATDEVGAMLQAYFAAVRNLAAETVWPISLSGAEPLVVPVTDERPEGRELSKPSVGYEEDDDAQEQNVNSDL